MDNDEELSHETVITGSDDLLADDHLRLPESASPLVRLHAVRAWLTRRQKETSLEIGMAALDWQRLEEDEPTSLSLRRREREERAERIQQSRQRMQDEQQRLDTYEEATDLLEECVNHVTVGERLLVEYYLMLEELVQNEQQQDPTQSTAPGPRLQALLDVQHRVEHVGIPGEED